MAEANTVSNVENEFISRSTIPSSEACEFFLSRHSYDGSYFQIIGIDLVDLLRRQYIDCLMLFTNLKEDKINQILARQLDWFSLRKEELIPCQDSWELVTEDLISRKEE